jgi:hypothetical protein
MLVAAPSARGTVWNMLRVDVVALTPTTGRLLLLLLLLEVSLGDPGKPKLVPASGRHLGTHCP